MTPTEERNLFLSTVGMAAKDLDKYGRAPLRVGSVLSGIADEDLTTAEKQIKKIVVSVCS